jgi:DNA-directed RNA polymerase specialized sigma subunit
VQQQLVSYPLGVDKRRAQLREAIIELQEKDSHTPSVPVMAAHTGIETDEVVALLRLWPATSLDAVTPEYIHEISGQTLEEPDFVEQELERMEREEAIDEIFNSSALKDNEKILLSVTYGIFHRSLQGAELTLKGQTIFTYPYNEKDFLAAIRDKTSQVKISTEILGLSPTYASSVHDRALSKARKAFQGHPNFSDYDPRTEIDDRALEDQRQEVIDQALALSPDKPLGDQDIRKLRQQGKFCSKQVLYELFDSLPDFQKACGFSPDKGRVSRGMTSQEIVELALQIQADGPLTIPEIKRLSKEGKFVSMASIYSKFGSVPAFYEACGFSTKKITES